jgi:hypothetical protein
MAFPAVMLESFQEKLGGSIHLKEASAFVRHAGDVYVPGTAFEHTRR